MNENTPLNHQSYYIQSRIPPPASFIENPTLEQRRQKYDQIHKHYDSDMKNHHDRYNPIQNTFFPQYFAHNMSRAASYDNTKQHASESAYKFQIRPSNYLVIPQNSFTPNGPAYVGTFPSIDQYRTPLVRDNRVSLLTAEQAKKKPHMFPHDDSIAIFPNHMVEVGHENVNHQLFPQHYYQKQQQSQTTNLTSATSGNSSGIPQLRNMHEKNGTLHHRRESSAGLDILSMVADVSKQELAAAAGNPLLGRHHKRNSSTSSLPSTSSVVYHQRNNSLWSQASPLQWELQSHRRDGSNLSTPSVSSILTEQQNNNNNRMIPPATEICIMPPPPPQSGVSATPVYNNIGFGSVVHTQNDATLKTSPFTSCNQNDHVSNHDAILSRPSSQLNKSSATVGIHPYGNSFHTQLPMDTKHMSDKTSNTRTAPLPLNSDNDTSKFSRSSFDITYPPSSILIKSMSTDEINNGVIKQSNKTAKELNKNQSNFLLKDNSSGAKKSSRKRGRRRKCMIATCSNRVVQGGLCISHGAKRKSCSVPGCEKSVKQAGLCSTHGPARKRCEVEGCTKVSVQGGKCISHGARKQLCKIEGCTKYVLISRMCKRHYDREMGNSKNRVKNKQDNKCIEKDKEVMMDNIEANLLCGVIDDGKTMNINESSTETSDKRTHKRGLSLFHDLNAVDTIILNESISGQSPTMNRKDEQRSINMYHKKIKSRHQRGLSIFADNDVAENIIKQNIII